MADRRRVARRIDAALRRRAATGDPPLTIRGRGVYILPTAPGGLFALLLVAMLVGATNYGNNLAFALCFWLAAAALVSMHRAHRNLVGLTVAAVQAAPVFAGTPARFEIRLTSDARLPRRGLGVTGGQTDRTTPVAVGPAAAQAHIKVNTRRRGWLACPRLTVASRYPMGFFRCWCYAAPSARVLVYPRPLDVRGPNATAPSADSTHAVSQHAGEAAFIGHRRYQIGDSPRVIDWKASARTDDLLVVEHGASRAPTRWFDYAALGDLSPETRLSQLAFWIIAAERAGLPYGLRLPGDTLGPAVGAAHYRACMQALALF